MVELIKNSVSFASYRTKFNNSSSSNDDIILQPGI